MTTDEQKIFDIMTAKALLKKHGMSDVKQDKKIDDEVKRLKK